MRWRWSGARWLAWALSMSACVTSQPPPPKKAVNRMNADIPLYQMTRSGDAIATAEIVAVKITPGPRPGVETVQIEVKPRETLWGKPGGDQQSYSFERPVSPAARMKFPDPVWGRVDVRQGALILIVIPPANGEPLNPVYADEIPSDDDPVLREIRSVLRSESEKRGAGPAAAVPHQLTWLTSGGRTQKLFAAESLANEGVQIPEQRGRIISSYVKVFAAEQDPYLKINFGTWLWEGVYPLADQLDQVRIVNATISAAGSKDTNVRDFALDRLAEADPAVFRLRGIASSPEAVRQLEQRKSNEQDADTRKHLEAIISAIRH